MTPEQARTALRAIPPGDAAAIFRGAIQLLRKDYPELALPLARRAAKKFPTNPQIQQLLGLLARATGDSRTALDAFTRTARLAPADPLVAHSLARAALEAGKPASDLFARAATLAPQDGSVLLGRAAALVNEGQAQLAVEELGRTVEQNPGWLEGQRSLAHLRGQIGMDPAGAIEAALNRTPGNPDLHRMRIKLDLEAPDLEAASKSVAAARAAVAGAPWLDMLAAHTASESGALERADALFAAAGPPNDIADTSLLARHHLRAGRPSKAAGIIEPFIEQDRDHLLWPYLSLAWRLMGDKRWQWLEGDPSLVGVYDLAPKVGDFDGLARHLRQLHFATRAPMDQSVRGGTQTDGNLLLRTEPVIQKLRALLLDTVAAHIAQLPAARPGHPTLLPRRKPQRIAGSWSVRLTDAGFHVDHVHSAGWFSSAFYVALPDLGPAEGRAEHAGWLSLGESRDLVPDVEPVRLIEPRPGRLVLFPSTMWHGTRPFPSGERMTVAFDIGRPRQS